jgi:undecaprenyl diphosphate synthase
VIQKFIYQLYSRGLQSKVLQGLLPEHVAVILDGNRRFADSMNSPSLFLGYQKGAQKVSQLLDWCQDLGIPQVTIWVLSTDNLKRPPEQVQCLYQVIEEEIVKIAQGQERSGTPRSIRFFGQLEALSPSLRQALDQAGKMTEGYKKFF